MGGKESGGFVPSEGVAALVLEPAGRTEARAYANFISGRWAAGGDAAEPIRHMLGGSVPSLTICAGNGAPCSTGSAGSRGSTAALAREIGGQSADVVAPHDVAAGLIDSGALLQLVLGLSGSPRKGPALVLGSSGDRGFAALRLEIV